MISSKNKVPSSANSKTPGFDFTAPVKACQSVGTYECDFITPKKIFMQGETVYGKETYTNEIHFRLRIRDIDNNVVFCSDPVYGKEVRCSYRLKYCSLLFSTGFSEIHPLGQDIRCWYLLLNLPEPSA